MSVLDFSPLKFTSILWLVLSVYFRFAHGGGGEFECSREVHQEIRRLAVNCEPREQVVALPLPNSSYMAVTPSHVTVKRCGGACNRRFMSCIPSQIHQKSVDVLLMPVHSQSGAVPAECASASVEEHLACTCGCPGDTGTRTCTQLQHFVHSQCRCACNDQATRRECIANGNYWDDDSCQCLCGRPSEWPSCTSGYVFSPAPGTCQCVRIAENARTVIEILIIILVTSTTMSGFLLAQCYRTRTGLFKPDISPDANGVPPNGGIELKTLFRMLSGGGAAVNPRAENEHSVSSSRNTNSSSTASGGRRRNEHELTSTFFPPSVSTPMGRSAMKPSNPGRGDYAPLSQNTSRSQSDASMITDLLSSPSQGPSRVQTIAEELDELEHSEQ